MRNDKRRDMLKTLVMARERCRADYELYELGSQLDRPINYLVLLVAGERRCCRYDVVNTNRLFSDKMPFGDRLKAIEEAVREVYSDFEVEIAREKYEDGPALTLGDRMVFEAVDDAVWMISGLWDECREVKDGRNGQGCEAEGAARSGVGRLDDVQA